MHCIVTVGSITLLLRKERVVDVDGVFIVTSAITDKRKEMKSNVWKKYIHIQTYMYCSATTPLWRSYFKLVRFHFNTAMFIRLKFSGMLGRVGYYWARNTSICSHWRFRHYAPPTRRHVFTTRHGVISQWTLSLESSCLKKWVYKNLKSKLILKNTENSAFAKMKRTGAYDHDTCSSDHRFTPGWLRVEWRADNKKCRQNRKPRMSSSSPCMRIGCFSSVLCV